METRTHNGKPVDLNRLVSLLKRWRDEIAGWEEAANIAARGNESGVASRNRVRAHSIRGCVDDLMEIIETNNLGKTFLEI